jgi:hypothetical protein
MKGAALLFVAAPGLGSLGLAETWGLPATDAVWKAWHSWIATAALTLLAALMLKVPDLEWPGAFLDPSPRRFYRAGKAPPRAPRTGRTSMARPTCAGAARAARAIR